VLPAALRRREAITFEAGLLAGKVFRAAAIAIALLLVG